MGLMGSSMVWATRGGGWMYIYPYLYPPKVTTLVVVSQFKASSGRGYRWNSDSSFCCFHENIPQSARRFSSSVPFPVVVAHPCCRRFSCPPNSQFPRTPVPAWYYTRLTPSLSSPGLLSLSLSPRSRLAHASLTPRSSLAHASLQISPSTPLYRHSTSRGLRQPPARSQLLARRCGQRS